MFGQGAVRFRNTEFFGVILPGFYVAAQVTALALVLPGVAEEVEWKAVPDLVAKLWAPGLVVFLFVSYLIGNVFRVTKMSDTDTYCYDLFHRWRLDRHLSEETRMFPYVKSLRSQKKAIANAIFDKNATALGAKVSADKNANTTKPDQEWHEWVRDHVPPYGLGIENDKPNDGDVEPWKSTHDGTWTEGEPIFGFWKARLCNENAAGFEFGQAAEARTRFFAGVMWAARFNVSLTCWLSLCLCISKASTNPGWQSVPFVVMAALALLILGLTTVQWKWLGPQRRKKEEEASEAKDDAREAASDRAASRWRDAVQIRLVLETLTPALSYAITSSSVATFAVVLALSLSSSGLFWYFGRRLRNVRNGEMRAVYLNYCALVLSPGDAKKG